MLGNPTLLDCSFRSEMHSKSSFIVCSIWPEDSRKRQLSRVSCTLHINRHSFCISSQLVERVWKGIHSSLLSFQIIYKAFNKATDHVCRYYAQAMVHKTIYGSVESKVYFTKLIDGSVSTILMTARRRATGAGKWSQFSDVAYVCHAYVCHACGRITTRGDGGSHCMSDCCWKDHIQLYSGYSIFGKLTGYQLRHKICNQSSLEGGCLVVVCNNWKYAVTSTWDAETEHIVCNATLLVRLTFAVAAKCNLNSKRDAK